MRSKCGGSGTSGRVGNRQVSLPSGNKPVAFVLACFPRYQPSPNSSSRSMSSILSPRLRVSSSGDLAAKSSTSSQWAQQSRTKNVRMTINMSPCWAGSRCEAILFSLGFLFLICLGGRSSAPAVAAAQIMKQLQAEREATERRKVAGEADGLQRRVMRERIGYRSK
jgi:hypothetical protein